MDKVCRTCLKVLKNDANCLSLDSVCESNFPSLRNKLSVCVPELALDIIQYAVICSICAEALNTSYLFKNKCLQTERTILDFTRHTGCSKSPINVSDLTQFTEAKSVSMGDQMEIKPVFCDVQNPSDGNLSQVKIEPGISTNNKPNYCASGEFESETNNLINSIPFNPELDVEVRGYTSNDMYKYPYADPTNLHNQNFPATPYYCVYCQKRFELLPQFEAHLTMHAMESRPLKCEMCERRFVRKDKLMLHMRIHTGEKPFKCTECGRCFSRKDKLNNHIRTHTGEKPHQCILCQKSFARKDKMNLHMKSQHWVALSNLEITVVKYAENTNGATQSVLTEMLPKTK